MSWKHKALLHLIFSQIPRGEGLAYFCQRYVTRSMPITDSQFVRMVFNVKEHLDVFQQYYNRPLGEATFYEFGTGPDMVVPLHPEYESTSTEYWFPRHSNRSVAMILQGRSGTLCIFMGSFCWCGCSALQGARGGPDGTPEFSFILVGWGSGTGEASSPLKSLIHTYDKSRGFGASNRGRYSNKKVDTLIEDALVFMAGRRLR